MKIRLHIMELFSSVKDPSFITSMIFHPSMLLFSDNKLFISCEHHFIFTLFGPYLMHLKISITFHKFFTFSPNPDKDVWSFMNSLSQSSNFITERLYLCAQIGEASCPCLLVINKLSKSYL